MTTAAPQPVDDEREKRIQKFIDWMERDFELQREKTKQKGGGKVMYLCPTAGPGEDQAEVNEAYSRFYAAHPAAFRTGQ